MKRTFIAIGIALTLSMSAQAKTPKDVLEPYKAYRAAIAAQDAPKALKQSKLAWEAAEEHLGDSKMTGDLAQNFAKVKSGDKATKSQIKAMERALELSTFYGDDAGVMHLQRGVSLLELYSLNKATSKVRKQSKSLIEFAKENELDRSVFYAEVLTLRATTMIESRKGEDIVEVTAEALDVFANPSEFYDSVYPIFAHLYNGFGHEYEEEVLEAALSYQKVMDYVGKLDYETHPVVGRALGRWSHMRGRLVAEGKIDAAKEAGVCDCWPYDIERNESVKPIKRRPPRFSSKALRSGVSGYTIVQFDLSDEGKPTNAKKIVSWPPGLYEKTSLLTLEGWEYSPRAEGETDADRSNLITTIRYVIEDRNGNPIY